jgi:AcrR family transcriptional regulator
MSPRGIAIPDLREQLFRAADQVLVRDGPSALSGRAITREAGCATGLLYNHFGDLDEFLAQFVLDRVRLAAERAAELPARAGEGTLADNLTDAALSIPGSSGLAMIALVQAQPSVAARLRRTAAGGAQGLQTIEHAFLAYLEAEKEIGRVAPHADTEALALGLVGAIHDLWRTATGGTLERRRVRRVLAALVAGATPTRS